MFSIALLAEGPSHRCPTPTGGCTVVVLRDQGPSWGSAIQTKNNKEEERSDCIGKHLILSTVDLTPEGCYLWALEVSAVGQSFR